MRLPRIYFPNTLTTGKTVELGGNAANHVARVLRLKAGDVLILFNGQGGEFQAVINAIIKKTVSIQVGEFRNTSCESNLKIHLIQGISRGERMDYTLQKAVELGISSVTPVITERTVVKLDASRSRKRRQHWQGIVTNACEQCGRNMVPSVNGILTYNEWLQHDATGTGLLLDPTAETSLSQLQSSQTLSLLAGPEGGLANHERQAAIGKGFSGVRLGPRVLRSETAAVTALAALQTLWGDLG